MTRKCPHCNAVKPKPRKRKLITKCPHCHYKNPFIVEWYSGSECGLENGKRTFYSWIITEAENFPEMKKWQIEDEMSDEHLAYMCLNCYEAIS